MTCIKWTSCCHQPLALVMGGVNKDLLEVNYLPLVEAIYFFKKIIAKRVDICNLK